MSHPLQGGSTEKLLDQAAVMDAIPYSRVFFHVFPCAIVMHRGKRYKIHSMNAPPCALLKGSMTHTLYAFAKPTLERYSTMALSTTLITVSKQMQSIDIEKSEIDLFQDDYSKKSKFDPILSSGSLSGSGVVNIKRTVHGFKKLSLVNRAEVSS